MRYRALAGLVLLAMVGSLLSGCTGSDGTAAMLKLEEGLEAGQTLSAVQASMSEALKARATTYPAKNLKKTASGNWVFTAMEDGASDADAPFQVILIAPELASANSLAILFNDEAFVESVWYAPTSVSMLKKALLGNIYEDNTTDTK